MGTLWFSQVLILIYFWEHNLYLWTLHFVSKHWPLLHVYYKHIKQKGRGIYPVKRIHNLFIACRPNRAVESMYILLTLCFYGHSIHHVIGVNKWTVKSIFLLAPVEYKGTSWDSQKLYMMKNVCCPLTRIRGFSWSDTPSDSVMMMILLVSSPFFLQ